MNKVQALSLSLLSMLIMSYSTVSSPVAAQVQLGATDSTFPEITSDGNYSKIATEQFTLLFPRNGTKPSFVWWANSDNDTVYAVHYKELIEYAQINNSAFKLQNVAEAEVWERLIDEINEWDLNRLGMSEKGMSAAFKAGSSLLLVQGRLINEKANMTDISQIMKAANQTLHNLKGNVTDQEVVRLLNSTIAKIKTAVDMIENGAKPKEVRTVLIDAIKDIQKVIKIGIEKTKDLVGQIIDERQKLKDIAKNFHPSSLSFSAAKWQMSGVQNITADGNTIGLSFNMTIVSAPKKFSFAENNVTLIIRIYNMPVTETFSVGSETYSYDVAAGELKMDLVINGWEWNFAPKTIAQLSSTSLTISPALALRVDASTFNATGVDIEEFFKEMDEIRTNTTIQATSFDKEDSHTNINIKKQDSEATPLNFKATLVNKNVVGKYMKFAPAAKLKLTEEGVIGGFFKFVPFAKVINYSGQENIVNVSASYFSAGNHVKMYLCYPYFNGTLNHDPSLGVETTGSSNTQPKYLVALGAWSNGVATVQIIPAEPAWGNPKSLAIAGGIVALAAIVILIVVRKHPTIV